MHQNSRCTDFDNELAYGEKVDALRCFAENCSSGSFSFGDIQGSFGSIQGLFWDIQGSFGDIQGSFWDIQGSFGDIQSMRCVALPKIALLVRFVLCTCHA